MDDEQVDDAADAWGWGDDDDAIDAEPATELAVAQTSTEGKNPLDRHVTPITREMTLSEKYWTSSLPRAVYSTVEQVYNNGSYLKRPE